MHFFRVNQSGRSPSQWGCVQYRQDNQYEWQQSSQCAWQQCCGMVGSIELRRIPAGAFSGEPLRWPDEYNRESEPDQQTYGRSFWWATRETGSRISEGRVSSYRQLWSEACDWRSRNAGSQSKGFDTERGPGHQGTLTPLEGTYEYIRDRYSTRTDGAIRESSVSGAPPSRRYQLTDEIDGWSIALRSIVLSGDPRADRDSPFYTGLRDAGLDDGEPFHIDHTALSEVPRIMDHAESLYSKALDTSVSDSQALSTRGELHWWGANAMPDDRGSAAKTEFTVRSFA
jgi:avirulence protein